MNSSERLFSSILPHVRTLPMNCSTALTLSARRRSSSCGSRGLGVATRSPREPQLLDLLLAESVKAVEQFMGKVRTCGRIELKSLSLEFIDRHRSTSASMGGSPLLYLRRQTV